jgi:predicted GNAT superfamily acetyltransferase
MEIERCTKADFLDIVDDLPAYWGSDRTAGAHHPMVIEEFGDTAFVAREDGAICGYLFGFFAQTGPYFFIHLVGVRDTHKGRGIGRALYAHVEEIARARGATALKAITSLSNAGSVAFHAALGFTQLGEGEQAGIRYVPSYFSRTRNMVVLWKDL